MNYSDHFSASATIYRRGRPHYPAALFEALRDAAPELDLAWDCATGNGQAAIGLSRHFRKVVATDASANQIAEAMPAENVSYLVAPAERAPLEDAAADLVTVAEALHWFNAPAFYAELRRVLRSGGVFAAWSYGDTVIASDVDAVVAAFKDGVLAQYWPARARHADVAGAMLPPGFDVMPFPAFDMTAEWRVDDFLTYVHSWSATQRIIKVDPGVMQGFAKELSERWGAAARLVRWPLSLRLGRLQ
jgi:SAM-dependent methyltransferase